MTEVTTVVDGYIAMWNETDPERRRWIIEQTWTDDGSYVDPHADVEGEVELAAPAPLAPVAQQRPDPCTYGHLGHRGDDSAGRRARHLPRR